MTIEWRDIPGYEGLYQVSNDGQVRSLDRIVTAPNRWGTVNERTYKGKLLTPQKCSNDYLKVCFKNKGRQELVHRLVAKAFIPGDFSLQVNHKNGCRYDNRVENLEWATCSDNHKHSYRALSRKKHVWTKSVSIEKDGVTLSFESGAAAARHLGVSPGSISSAFNKNHKCCGYEVKVL